MINNDWQKRLAEMEITPPATSWQKISEQKGRSIAQRSWKKTAIAASVIGLGLVASLVYFQTKNNSQSPHIVADSQQTERLHQNDAFQSKGSKLSNEPIETKKEDTAVVQGKISDLIPQNLLVSNSAKISEPEVDINANSFMSDFPYNGKVKNQIEVDSNNSPLPQYFPNLNIEVPVAQNFPEKKEVSSIKPEEALFELPEISNLCTPNGDDNNDQFCPLEKFPDELAVGWALIKNGQVIRTFGAFECWDGNNVGGFPMESGNYGVEIYYKGNTSNPHILRKSMECLLMR